MPESEPPAAETENDGPSPGRKVTVLLISNVPDDVVMLRNIFQHTNWELLTAKSAGDAQGLLNSRSIPVVLTVPVLPDGVNWRELLRQASGGIRPRFVVTAPQLDERLWAEVLNLGGYDVLMKPFDHSEVIRIVSLAWLNWRDEMAARRALASPPGAAGSEIPDA